MTIAVDLGRKATKQTKLNGAREIVFIESHRIGSNQKC